MLSFWKAGRNNRVTRHRTRDTRHKTRNTGFLLFEVMVTVAILSLGLTLILRSFTTSLGAIRTSQNYMLACLLLEEKMWELEEEAESTKKITTEPSRGEFTASNGKDKWRERFSWETACEDLLDEEGEETSLDKVTVTVAWRESRSQKSVWLTTYLVNEEE